MRQAPLRSGLVVLGIALGVAVVVASRATSDALQHTFDDLVERIGDRAELVVVGNQSGVPSGLVSELAEVEGVAHVAAALEVTTSFAGDGEPLLILGVDFLGDTHFLPFEPAGGDKAVVKDPLSFVNDPSAILLSETLAARRKLKLGSRLRVVGAGGLQTLHVRGVLKDSGPAASFGGQVAVMFLDAAQVTFGRGTLVDRIDLALTEGADRTTTLRRLRSVVKGGARVEAPEQLGQRARSLSKPLSDGMQLSGVLALLVAAFIIYNAVGVSVAQRRKEIGVLRALGALRRVVVLHFCLEAAVLALVGVGLGLLLAQQLVGFTHEQARAGIGRVYGALPPAPAITIGHIVRGGLAALSVALLGALLPARIGSRLHPVAALQATSSVQSSHTLRYGRWAALGAFCMLIAWPVAYLGNMPAGYAATFLNLAGGAMLMPLLIVGLRRLLVRPAQRVLGMSGRLGLDYVERNLGRSTMNVLALMVAVALSLGISGFLRSFESAVRAWFEQISAADFAVTAGSPLADRRRMPLAADTVERLQGIAGLEAIQPMRMIDQSYGRSAVRLVASDTRVYLQQARLRGKPWKVLDGSKAVADGELYASPKVVLGENAARRLGLHAGDRLRLHAPAGALDFEVRAVVVDYSSELGAAFIDRRYYLEGWGDSAIDVINLYARAGSDQKALAAEVRKRLGGDEALFVTQTSALRDEFLRSADEGFAYTRSIELIVLLIAIMGVVGTMVASVLDRMRELGMLRAIGATRAQITLAMVIEASFLGLCAVIGGVASGSVQCVLLLQTVVAQNSGWHLDFVFPLGNMLRFGSLVLIVAAIAGLFPGLRAARLDVKAALAAH